MLPIAAVRRFSTRDAKIRAPTFDFRDQELTLVHSIIHSISRRHKTMRLLSERTQHNKRRAN